MKPSNAILVRVGVDASHGMWNAPADPRTGEFLYVPIPEACQLWPDYEIGYSTLLPTLRDFCRERGLDLDQGIGFPFALHEADMHLDPDFDHLTYGDNAAGRGSGIAQLDHGDDLIFYAGLRSVVDHQLIYALIGMLRVDEVVPVGHVARDRWHENAHTRRLSPSAAEIVVRGMPGVSGRLTRYIPIGEWRDGAYRVRNDLLAEWGGLSVHDGFIQRSARPPRFLDPQRFSQWLDQQHTVVMERNN